MPKLSKRRRSPDGPPQNFLPVISYTGTVTAGSGSITIKTGTARYSPHGKLVFIKIRVVITTNGTGATSIIMTLPLTAAATGGAVLAGRNSNDDAVHGYIAPSGTTCVMRLSDGTYPGGSGVTIDCSGFYESA